MAGSESVDRLKVEMALKGKQLGKDLVPSTISGCSGNPL
jgi:hypothetical protein